MTAPELRIWLQDLEFVTRLVTCALPGIQSALGLGRVEAANKPTKNPVLS